MSEERAARVRGGRARGFESFVAGAGARLLHAATLLTAETADRNPRARQLLVSALARTYAEWDRLRDEDPYDHARRELAGRFALGAWRFRRAHGGVLGQLRPRERLVLVLRLYEGVPEEQTAALLGLSPERIHAVCHRAVATVHTPGAA
ncbi:sigma factor-like helix-turn-helix DNA-binding protein [Streptomyces sp. NPDC003691]